MEPQGPTNSRDILYDKHYQAIVTTCDDAVCDFQYALQRMHQEIVGLGTVADMGDQVKLGELSGQITMMSTMIDKVFVPEVQKILTRIPSLPPPPSTSLSFVSTSSSYLPSPISSPPDSLLPHR